MKHYAGIDIGSRSSKGVVTAGGDIVASHVIPSGTDYRKAAAKLLDELVNKAGIEAADLAFISATGQGAAMVPGADETVADMRCAARGINRLNPAARTVIDIESQSTQIISINAEGRVVNQVTSERCASGSGRFMEVIANVLRVNLADIGPISLTSDNPITFTTGCAVFGESEAISRVAEGVAVADILSGVHEALATKISAMTGRIALEPAVAICGGGALDTGLVKAVAAKLGVEVLVPANPQMVTALGAAVIAAEDAALPPDERASRPSPTPFTKQSLGGEI